MFYLTYAPGPPINEFVDYFWLFEGGQTARKERIVPSGTIGRRSRAHKRLMDT
jgi:hypothetical protein